MTKADKLLVIAGTHQRETGFSHPVADLLLYQHQLNHSVPKVFIGEDGATKALVWNSKDIVVAKLFEHGNGKPTTEWLNNQSLERLVFLNQFKIRNSNSKKAPRVAETFGGQGQWTSVHDPIIQKYKPTFFIDLHSYHIYTEGQKGIGMQINSYADTNLHPIIVNALNNAQHDYPQTYGQPQPNIKSLREIRNELYAKYFTKEELADIISANQSINKYKIKHFSRKIPSLDKEAHKLIEKESDNAFEKGWHFTTFGKPETRGNYFLFEAKHWQENQQKATAYFISSYLIPEIKRFRN